MVPTKDQINKLLQKYAPSDEQYELVKLHGEIVAEIALWCADNVAEDVNAGLLQAACLLHDIGSYVFIGAANHDERFEKSYPGHAILGAKILQDEGLDQGIWEAVETHVLLGLSSGEIAQMGFRLPDHNYLPRTVEGELLCYADRFHSKEPRFNDYDSFIGRLKNQLPNQAQRMNDFSNRFGVPDIKKLAKKYGHPVR